MSVSIEETIIAPDIRTRATSEIGRSVDDLNFVISSMPGMVCWKAADDFRYLGCNQAFADMAGMPSPEDIIGKTDFELPWKREQAEFYRSVDSRIASTGVAEKEYTEPIRDADGTERWIKVSKQPMHDKSGNIIAVLAVIEDITERKAAEEALKEQTRAVMELSTPVVKVWDGILLLPLVGTMDTARSAQMTERLLSTIGETDAQFVILDVTGLPHIDTSVARHILTTVDAAKILGTQVIITGFSPVAAQTLAQLGVDFSSLRTRGSLSTGMQEAMNLMRNGANGNGR